AGFSPVHLIAHVVQDHLDLARVARVDNPRGVQYGQAVLVGKAGAGADHAHVARWDCYMNAGADEPTRPRVKGNCLDAVEVKTRVRVVRAGKVGSTLIESELDLQNVCPFMLIRRWCSRSGSCAANEPTR